MHNTNTIKKILFTLVLCISIGSIFAQSYRDQMVLIRLQPNYAMVFGRIADYSGEKLSGASVSIFDPSTYSIRETIPVDDLGDYLFTVEKGKKLGLLVEKEGYFPYYNEFQIPEETEEQYEYSIQLPDGIRKQYSLIYSQEGYIPANGAILEEMVSLLINQPELSLWMPGQENPLGKSRIVFVDSLIKSRGIEDYRIISGSLPGNNDQIVELFFETDPDAETLTAWSDNPTSINSRDDYWTLQFSASKSKLSERDLRGLENVKIYEGSDGFYRYTYGSFETRQEANQSIQYLKNKGFKQAFPKLIKNLKKL